MGSRQHLQAKDRGLRWNSSSILMLDFLSPQRHKDKWCIFMAAWKNQYYIRCKRRMASNVSLCSYVDKCVGLAALLVTVQSFLHRSIILSSKSGIKAAKESLCVLQLWHFVLFLPLIFQKEGLKNKLSIPWSKRGGKKKEFKLPANESNSLVYKAKL